MMPAATLDDAAGQAYFKQKIRSVLGVDLSQYRSEQMDRRLKSFVSRFPGDSGYTLGRRLQSDPAFAGELANFLTINVTEFFRNPERYEELEMRVLPSLKGRAPLKLWSAGCSIGAEPYSLAMLLRSAGLTTSRVQATDIDRTALRVAREGVYKEEHLRSVSHARRKLFFEEQAGAFRVAPAVRQMVTFQEHDLLRSPFPEQMDLIVCRNVVIYFTETARSELYRKFSAALRPGGVLFVGSTESVYGAKSLGLEPFGPFFYRKSAEGR